MPFLNSQSYFLYETNICILQLIFGRQIERNLHLHNADCDSFVLSNKTIDLMKDMIKLQEEKTFLGSHEISTNHPQYCNQKMDVIAKFETETPDSLIKDICTLRSEAHAFSNLKKKKRKNLKV